MILRVLGLVVEVVVIWVDFSLFLNVIVLEGIRVGGSAGFFIRSDSFSWGENGLGFAIISHRVGIVLHSILSTSGDFVVNEIFV